MEKTDMHHVHLALGTNLGNRRQNLAEAIKRLQECAQVVTMSSVFETEPWGIEDQPSFLNQVVLLQTSLSPYDLFHCAKDIEATMGRKADGIRYGPRLIDIDILFYDQLIFESYNLTIPHPRLVERAFVLLPLVEISPRLVYPGLGITIQTLGERIDKAGVERVD